MTDIEINPQGEVVLDVDRSIYDHSDDRFLCPESDHAGDVR